MLVAEPAKASTASNVWAAIGPASTVSGAASTPGSGSSVFQVRLTPSGTASARLNHGECPVSTACGVQPRNQSVCGRSPQAHWVRRPRSVSARAWPSTARSR